MSTVVETVSAFSHIFGPFIKRRPVTSYSEHHSFAPSPSTRVKSAAINMPRSHVSVARFYDWTEDLGECVSVSQFYRDLAAYNKLQNEKMKGKTRAIVNPGRMFLRDKAGLTKGEREIIEGIYKNRCNIGKDESVDNSKEDWHLVKSHKDAWLIGKHFQRSSTNKSDSASDVWNDKYTYCCCLLCDNKSSTNQEHNPLPSVKRIFHKEIDNEATFLQKKKRFLGIPYSDYRISSLEKEIFRDNIKLRTKLVPRIDYLSPIYEFEGKLRTLECICMCRLTKGEREIIEGIYKNRCNIGKDESVDSSKDDWHLVKSHKDAWLIGKHFQRSSTNKSDSASDDKSDLASSSPTDSCNNCNKTDEGALAPPTTPDPEDKVDSKQLWKRKNPHRGSHGHPLDIVDGNHKHSTKKDSKDQGKKKLYVNVFLPSISGEG
ncbi:Hypothetical predicted protein [Mytilus galloprovincialis]|uniref:Uncharacterized protein n=1 Tax=Mytilus galloprovincialis TaxID=29158 RepID=A0A8B6F2Y4_MYTGA|nr:Hypothetical predicted protein [Mytilus galloprovincialis]